MVLRVVGMTTGVTDVLAFLLEDVPVPSTNRTLILLEKIGFVLEKQLFRLALNKNKS
jgi:hypothetical protein